MNTDAFMIGVAVVTGSSFAIGHLGATYQAVQVLVIALALTLIAVFDHPPGVKQ